MFSLRRLSSVISAQRVRMSKGVRFNFSLKMNLTPFFLSNPSPAYVQTRAFYEAMG